MCYRSSTTSAKLREPQSTDTVSVRKAQASMSEAKQFLLGGGSGTGTGGDSVVRLLR